MTNTIIVATIGISMMFSFFLGVIFGGVTIRYIKERKNDHVNN